MSKKKTPPEDYVDQYGTLHHFWYNDDGELVDDETENYNELYCSEDPDDPTGEKYKDEFSVLGGLGAWLRGEYD